jgi:hypothetical protein
VDDDATSVTLDDSGNIIVGATISDLTGPGDARACVIKMDGDGNPAWERCWGAPGVDNLALPATFRGLTTDASGNVYMAGGIIEASTFLFNPLLLKLTPSGDLAWARTEARQGKLGSVALDGSGRLLVSGMRDAVPFQQYFVAQVDGDGNSAGSKVWSVENGDRAENPDIGMLRASNGKLFITGTAPNATGSWADDTFDLTTPASLFAAQSVQATTIALGEAGSTHDAVAQTGGVETGGGAMDALLLELSTPALSGPGDSCTGGSTCQSGFCSDGVCCKTDCGNDASDCQACGADGVCQLRTNLTCGVAPSTTSCLAQPICGATAICPAPAAIPECSSVTMPSCPAAGCSVQTGDSPTRLIERTSVTFHQHTDPGEMSTQKCGDVPSDDNNGYPIVKSATDDTELACTDITVSAAVNYSSAIQSVVCLFYGAPFMDDGQGGRRDQNTIRLKHYEGGIWKDITATSPRLYYQAPDATHVEQLGEICGNTNTLSPFAIFTPKDGKPPVFGGVPTAPVVAYATSTSGAKVKYKVPAAVDAGDGPTAVSCLPASGSPFPVGQTTVNCTSSDQWGNVGKAAFKVWVQVQAPAGGSLFGPPIDSDGSSVFKRNSTVPVKFRLTGASADIKNLKARLYVAGTAYEFRYDCGQYIYNLSTKPLSVGALILKADLGDGVDHSVKITLR